MLDALLLALKDISVQLLPILGALVLIFLCILLKKLVNLMNSLTKTIDNLSPTLKLVDQSLEKCQAPLDSVVKLSHTVDNVHDKTIESVNKASEYMHENMHDIKNKFSEKISEVKNVLKKEEENKNE